MSVPPHVVQQAGPSGLQVPPGYTINKHQVPPNTHYNQGAGSAHYERPSTQRGTRLTDYTRKWNVGNGGRSAETSFTNTAGTGSDPFADISRNTERIRQRRPIQRQGGSGTSGGTVRPAPSSQGNVAPGDGSVRIPIPSSGLSESLPLLEGARNTAVSGGLGLGLAGAATATALGAGTASLINHIKNNGATLPGTDYVGPGNDIRIDAPRSGSDAIAKEHDVGYDNIQTRARAGQLTEEEFAANVEHLDNEAIRKFADNYHSSGEWQSFVGRWGLYLKNRIEAVTGTLYPTFPGKTWANGKIFRRIKKLIGCASMRDKDDTLGNSTTWHSCAEA